MSVLLPILLILKIIDTQTALKTSPKVQVDVYYETLCPDSMSFITSQLWPAWQSIGDIMELSLIPYGKAKSTVSKSGNVRIYCQHGDSECQGNMIQACAMDIHNNNMSIIMPFVKCMESERRPHTAGEKCAQKCHINYGAIQECVESGRGKELHFENGKRTENLKEKLTFVPWILCNGEYTDENQETALYGNFKGMICDKYKGPNHPGCEDTL